MCISVWTTRRRCCSTCLYANKLNVTFLYCYIFNSYLVHQYILSILLTITCNSMQDAVSIIYYPLPLSRDHLSVKFPLDAVTVLLTFHLCNNFNHTHTHKMCNNFSFNMKQFRFLHLHHSVHGFKTNKQTRMLKWILFKCKAPEKRNKIGNEIINQTRLFRISIYHSVSENELDQFRRCLRCGLYNITVFTLCEEVHLDWFNIEYVS